MCSTLYADVEVSGHGGYWGLEAMVATGVQSAMPYPMHVHRWMQLVHWYGRHVGAKPMSTQPEDSSLIGQAAALRTKIKLINSR
jgi:hypothetical protein